MGIHSQITSKLAIGAYLCNDTGISNYNVSEIRKFVNNLSAYLCNIRNGIKKLTDLKVTTLIYFSAMRCLEHIKCFTEQHIVLNSQKYSLSLTHTLMCALSDVDTGIIRIRHVSPADKVSVDRIWLSYCP